jgi:hypothetical protein
MNYLKWLVIAIYGGWNDCFISFWSWLSFGSLSYQQWLVESEE